MNIAILLAILGYICIIHGLAIVPVVMYATLEEHGFILPCIDTVLVSFVLGVVALKRYKKLNLRSKWVYEHKGEENFSIREGIAFLCCGWFIITFLGSLPYFLSGYFNFFDALFESAAAVTTTGISAMPMGKGFPHTLLLWHVWAQWLGGIGSIITFILLMPRLGRGAGYLFSAEVQGASAERTLPRTIESAYIIFAIYAGTTVLETAVLHFAGLAMLPALAMSMATVSTGGFSQLQYFLINNKSLLIEFLLMLFMIIGSINCVLYYRVLQRRFEFLRQDTESKWYFGIMLTAIILIMANLYLTHTYDFASSGRYALFQTVSIMSTTGLATTDYTQWPSFSRLLLFYLAIIGGCSGSTAGGLKISRIVVLVKICQDEIIKTIHPRLATVLTMGKRPVPARAIGGMGRYFYLYFLVFTLLVVLYSLTGSGIMETLSTVVNCFSNLGAPYSLIGKNVTYVGLPVYNRIILYLTMILGRIELFTMIMVLQPSFWRKKRSW
jgi:trk system potassium uptake protein TrkH